jgi:hypothetical protein
MSKKDTTALAIRRETSIAAKAWQRLENAAEKAMNGGSAPAMQVYADQDGITALLQDTHGTVITVEHGRISVTAGQTGESSNE